jgi:hypothetical protein
MQFLINRVSVFFVLIFITLAIGNTAFSQTCPTFQKRNNGNNAETCGSTTGLPANYTKTGKFSFTNASPSSDITRNKIWKNGVLYQDGSTLTTPGTIWFGDYVGSTKQICFYADGGNGVPPAANWKFEFFDGTNTYTCTFSVDAQGNPSTFSAGTIGSSQTICSGSTPSGLTSSSLASPCSGVITYQWQGSTTSSSTGFNDISSATSSTYSPGAISQTTYFQRLATCSSDSSVAISNVITITVPTITSPTVGTTWDANNTITFASNVSGGSWSSSNTSVANINSSSGVLTASTAGSTTITYTVTSGGVTCSPTRTVNITGTTGSLPVTWETVSAEKQNGQSVLRWSTASEQNTKDFVVQHSLNTTDWSSLTTVPAAGNSTTTRNYSYVHQNPLKGNNYNYYRILQRDIDDKFSYSKIVSIIFNEPGADLQVYPNPVQDQLTIFLAETQLVRLVNAAGATVWKGQLPAGRNTIPVKTYSKGIYVLTAGMQSQRVLIQ